MAYDISIFEVGDDQLADTSREAIVGTRTDPENVFINPIQESPGGDLSGEIPIFRATGETGAGSTDPDDLGNRDREIIERPIAIRKPWESLGPAGVPVIYLVGKRSAVEKKIVEKPGISLKGGAVGGISLGGTLGSIIPGIGNVAGSVIGGAVGAVTSIFSKDKETPFFHVYNEQFMEIFLQADPSLEFVRVSRGSRGVKYFHVKRQLDPEAIQKLVEEVNKSYIASLPELSNSGDREEIGRAVPTLRLTKDPAPDELKMFSFLELQTAEKAGDPRPGLRPASVPAAVKAAGATGLLYLLSTL